jgi:hypothetical protein
VEDSISTMVSSFARAGLGERFYEERAEGRCQAFRRSRIKLFEARFGLSVKIVALK